MSGKFNFDKLDFANIHEMRKMLRFLYADLGKKLFVVRGYIHGANQKAPEFGIVKGTN